MPTARKIRNVKEQSLIKDSRERARARAPIGTPAINALNAPRIQSVKGSQQQNTTQPINRKAASPSPSLAQPEIVPALSSSERQESTGKDDPDWTMASYDDFSAFTPYNYASEIRLPLTRRGRKMEEDEEPRSLNPVSLEDYIVYKPTSRSKAFRDAKVSQTINKRDDASQNVSTTTAAPAQDKPVNTYQAPTQRVNLGPYPKDMTQMPTLFNSSALRAKRISKMEDLDEEFREQQHQNGDITVHRRDHDGSSPAFAPVGRVHQSDVSYFLQIYDRTCRDNQNDPQKVRLNREHIATMVRHMDAKRLQQMTSAGTTETHEPAYAGTHTSSGSPEAYRHGSRTTTTAGSDFASEIFTSSASWRHAVPAFLRGGVIRPHFYPEPQYEEAPPTAFRSGFPDQAYESWRIDTPEERAHQAYEREQRAHYVQQHFAAQRAAGTTVTGYEPSLPTSHEGYSAREDDRGTPAQFRLGFHPPAPRKRSIAATPSVALPRSQDRFHDFVPKVRPDSIVVKHEPGTFGHLLLNSARFEEADPRLQVRASVEGQHDPFEPSRITNEQMEASQPKSSQNPCRTFRGPHTSDAAKADYTKDLNQWWDSGRKAFQDSEAYATTILGGHGKLQDKDACVGTPLMVSLFKTLQSYEQSRATPDNLGRSKGPKVMPNASDEHKKALARREEEIVSNAKQWTNDRIH